MTKESVVNKLVEITNKCASDLKKVLNDNDMVYSVKYNTMLHGVPFHGILPEVNDDMIEDLFLDCINHADCVQLTLFTKDEVKEALKKYEEDNSPKSRILKHMSEIKRLKEKYHVSDEDLKDTCE